MQMIVGFRGVLLVQAQFADQLLVCRLALGLAGNVFEDGAVEEHEAAFRLSPLLDGRCPQDRSAPWNSRSARSLCSRGGNSTRIRPYTRLFGRKIFFFQDAAVVEFVAGGEVGERADGYFLFVGDAAAGPGLLVEIAQQG